MSEDILFQKAPLTDEEQKENEMMQELESGFKGAINFDDVSVEDITALVARLAQLLAEEADLLEQMQVEKIAPLQREKRLLTDALAVIKKRLPKEESFMDSLEDEQRDNLQNVILIFNEILEENYARLNTARLVNQRVVDAITDVVKEKAHQETYNGKGKATNAQAGSLSLSLNEKI